MENYQRKLVQDEVEEPFIEDGKPATTERGLSFG